MEESPSGMAARYPRRLIDGSRVKAVPPARAPKFPLLEQPRHRVKNGELPGSPAYLASPSLLGSHGPGRSQRLLLTAGQVRQKNRDCSPFDTS